VCFFEDHFDFLIFSGTLKFCLFHYFSSLSWWLLIIEGINFAAEAGRIELKILQHEVKIRAECDLVIDLPRIAGTIKKFLPTTSPP
jgi:hypothetical protein